MRRQFPNNLAVLRLQRPDLCICYRGQTSVTMLILSMNKDHVLNLTLAVYRVTDLFPEKEALRYRIREAATNIFASCIAGQDIRRDLELLKSHFVLAKAQGWVAEQNFLVLEMEYDKLYEQMHSDMILEEVFGERIQVISRINPEKKNNNNNKNNRSLTELVEERKLRIEKINQILKEKESITIKELMEKFPEVNRRTLLRDIDCLIKENGVKKQGNGRVVYYVLNSEPKEFQEIATENV